MTDQPGQNQDQSVSILKIAVNLYLNGTALALLGLVFCAAFLQAGFNLGPDQLAQFVIGAAIIVPVDLGIIFVAGSIWFLPLIKAIREIGRGNLPSPSEAAETWEDINGFPLRSMILSMAAWVVGVPSIAYYLVYSSSMTSDEAMVAGLICTLLGMTTSVGYYLRSRSIFNPLLGFLGRRVPERFTPDRMTSVISKMMRVFLFIWVAITLALVFQAYLWMQRTETGSAFSLANRLMDEMKKSGSATVSMDLGDYVLKPFVVDSDGKQVDGSPLKPDELAFVKTHPRMLAANEWLAKETLTSMLTSLLANWVPLPETALMPEKAAETRADDDQNKTAADDQATGKRFVVLAREPLTGGLHPGIVLIDNATPASRQGERQGLVLLSVFWLIALLIVSMYTVWLARDIGGPVVELKRSVDRSARLAQFERLPLVSDDEVGELTAAFNRMGYVLNQRLAERNTHLSSVGGAMDNLGQVMDHLGGVSSEQASDASEQAVSMHEISTTSEQIAATLRVIAENAQSVEGVAGKSLDACRIGQGQLGEVIVGMDSATSRSHEVAERMLALQEQANRIEGILHFIQDISEKMNLIALNASIEASGAGEAGERFGIIAQEMRKLAEKTMSGTREVQSLFTDLQAATGKAIIATEEGEKKVAAARKLSDKASEVFQNIVHWAGETARAAHEIAISSSQQTSATDHLASALGEIKETASRFAERSKAIETSVMELENIGSELRSLLQEGTGNEPGKESVN